MFESVRSYAHTYYQKYTIYLQIIWKNEKKFTKKIFEGFINCRIEVKFYQSKADNKEILYV